MNLEEKSKELKNKIKKLQSELSLVENQLKKECDHIFVVYDHSNDHDGWSWCEYHYYTYYKCEKCGAILKHTTLGSSIGSPRRYHEYILDYNKTLLKINDNEIEKFDPELKKFKCRSEFKSYNGKIEPIIKYGLKSFIEEYGVYDTSVIVESVKRK